MKEFSPGQANGDASLEEHKVYKVVTCNLESCVAVGLFHVRYVVGQFIKAPEGTKFFVFDSLTDADEFVHLHPDFRLWSVTAKGLHSAKRRVGDPTHSVDMEDFWKVYNRGRSYGILEGHRTPSGTLWADEVRLDKRLW
jgi:hypothetical protein